LFPGVFRYFEDLVQKFVCNFTATVKSPPAWEEDPDDVHMTSMSNVIFPRHVKRLYYDVTAALNKSRLGNSTTKSELAALRWQLSKMEKETGCFRLAVGLEDRWRDNWENLLEYCIKQVLRLKKTPDSQQSNRE
jgi:hypothetical protein